MHKYNVTVRDEVLDYEAERRYLATEREYAHRQAKKATDNWWLGLLGPGLGVVRRDGWLKYLKELDRYERALTHDRQGVEDGLIPCSFIVKHEGPGADHHIEIQVRVEDGRFMANQKVPERPERVDGAPNWRPNQPHFSGFHGFVRHHTELGPSGIGAVFSKLGTNDQAGVLFDPVYLNYAPETKLYYEIKSREVPEGVRGEIEV